MSRLPCIEQLEALYKKEEVPVFNVGDTVRVQTRVIEGEKERLQSILGVVVAKKGAGLSETFTLYRTAYGSSMERVFLTHSPRIAGIEVVRSGRVRRAKLYYLRGRTGKSSKLREQYVAPESAAEKSAVGRSDAPAAQ